MASTFFKLKSLSVRGYKNIKEIAINFEEKNGITVLIGKNGCGKSNILEAVSSIFAGLYKDRFHKPIFDYTINYELNGNDIEISYTKFKYVFRVGTTFYTKTAFHKESKHFLPKNVIACYSGESQRLWDNYYWPYYKEYISNIKKSEIIPELPMLYINRHNLSISLLTLFIFDFETYTDIKEFCCDKLNIKSIKNISFRYNVKKIREWKDNSVLQMIKQLNKVEDFSVLSADKVTLSLLELKKRMSYMREQEFFKTLYAATMPEKDKIITDISYDIILNNGASVYIDDLSEGEKKSLLITTILEVLADENSILLFDEPDSHVHISRKAELKELFDKYTNRENIVTTHSPTLAVKFDGHVEGLGLDEKGNTIIIDNEKAKLVSAITDGMWNTLEQNMFLASNKPMTLLVEGKTDKIHIEAAYKHLRTYYPHLDFDVFSMNSSEHIREVLIGMSCSEIKWEKQFVGIFDNDSAGIKDIGSGFEKEKTEEKIKHVKYKDGVPSTSFYAFLLPKPKGYTDNGFTIESCYDASKYEEAFSTALEDKKGYFVGLSIDTIADELKNKSKIILANNAKSFAASDFEGFKPIFELLDKIRELRK